MDSICSMIHDMNIQKVFQYFSRIFFIISGGILSFSYVLNVSRNLMSPSICGDDNGDSEDKDNDEDEDGQGGDEDDDEDKEKDVDDDGDLLSG